MRSLQHKIQIEIYSSSLIDVNGVTRDLHTRKSEHRWMINSCDWQQYREGQFHPGITLLMSKAMHQAAAVFISHLNQANQFIANKPADSDSTTC